MVPYEVRDNKARYPEAPPWPTLAYNDEIINIPANSKYNSYCRIIPACCHNIKAHFVLGEL